MRTKILFHVLLIGLYTSFVPRCAALSSPGLNLTFRTDFDIILAKESLRTGEGAIFFQHFRKTAGRSLMKFLGVVVQAKRINKGTEHAAPMKMWTHEFGTFPGSCLSAFPNTFYFTCLREPISRHVSEFWYAGPGAKMPAAYANTVEIWGKWIAKGQNNTALVMATNEKKYGILQRDGIKRGTYVENMYIRVFSGYCKYQEKILQTQQKRIDRYLEQGRRPPERLVLQTAKFEKSTVCPLGHHGCKLDRGEVTKADILMAETVLSRFNIVAITELLQDPAYFSHLKVLMGVQDIRPTLTLGVVGGKTQKLAVSNPPKTPIEILDKLRRENMFDSSLYVKFTNTAKEVILPPGL